MKLRVGQERPDVGLAVAVSGDELAEPLRRVYRDMPILHRLGEDATDQVAGIPKRSSGKRLLAFLAVCLGPSLGPATRVTDRKFNSV